MSDVVVSNAPAGSSELKLRKFDRMSYTMTRFKVDGSEIEKPAIMNNKECSNQAITEEKVKIPEDWTNNFERRRMTQKEL